VISTGEHIGLALNPWCQVVATERTVQEERRPRIAVGCSLILGETTICAEATSEHVRMYLLNDAAMGTEQLEPFSLVCATEAAGTLRDSHEIHVVATTQK